MLDCYCDYDPPRFYQARTVKAKRLHYCIECGKSIAVGEKHEYAFGTYGYGETYTPRTCQSCLNIRHFVSTNIPCFCWGHGNLIEDCRNIIRAAYEQAPDEVKGLAFGFGRLLVKAKRARQTQ